MYFDDTTEYDNSEYFHDNRPLFSNKLKIEIASKELHGITLWYTSIILVYHILFLILLINTICQNMMKLKIINAGIHYQNQELH